MTTGQDTPDSEGVAALPEGVSQIDRHSPVPFFFQLKSALLQELDRGHWAPGDRLPSESALCDHFGLSRSTVRQALAELRNEGRLRREKGRGTFVAEPRDTTWLLQSSHGFYDEANETGHEVTSEVLRCELAPLPGWASDTLGLEPGAEGVRVERLRSIDGEVVMYVESCLLPEFADVLLSADLTTSSLYGRLRERGIEVRGGRRVVEATKVTRELAELLKAEPGAPVLLVEAVSWDSELRSFEAYRAWHRSDRTKIVVQVLDEQAATTAGIDARTLEIDR